ncbi:MAG: hypothetical protein KDC92_02400 [Bacteroidetes bacterium]|nr:hypothetical protein [Bacteroidota bacterium]
MQKINRIVEPLVSVALAASLVVLLFYSAGTYHYTLAHQHLFEQSQAATSNGYNFLLNGLLGLFAKAFGVSNFSNLNFYQLSNYISATLSCIGVAFIWRSVSKNRVLILALLLGWFQLVLSAGFHYQMASALLVLGLIFWLIKLANKSQKWLIATGIAIGWFCSIHPLFWVISVGIWVLILSNKPVVTLKIKAFSVLLSYAAFVLFSKGHFYPMYEYEPSRFFLFGETVLSGKFNYWRTAHLYLFRSPVIGITLATVLLIAQVSRLNKLLIPIAILFATPIFFQPYIKADLTLMALPLLCFGLGIMMVLHWQNFQVNRQWKWILVVVFIFNQIPTPDKLSYFEPNIIYEPSKAETYRNEEFDYLAHHHFQEIDKQVQLASRSDGKVVHDFEGKLPFKENNIEKTISYEQHLWHNYKIGVFSLGALSPREKLMPSLNMQNVVDVDQIQQHQNIITILKDTAANQGVFSFRIGELDNALKHLKMGVINHPEHEGVAYLLAKCQYHFSFWDNALTSLEAALAFNPEFAEALCLKGEILLKKGEEEKALELLQASRKLSVNFNRSHWALGNYYLRLYNLDSASFYLQKVATERGPLQTTAQNQLEFIQLAVKDNYKEGYFKQKFNQILASQDPKSELVSFQKTMEYWSELDTANAQLFHAKGMAAMYLQDYGVAIESFNQSLACNPNLADSRQYLSQAYVNLGAEYFALDSFGLAQLQFSYALDNDPQNEQALRNSAIALTEMAKLAKPFNIDEAIAYLNQAISRYNYVPALVELGKIAIEKNDIQSAQIAFTRAHQIDKKARAPLEALIKISQQYGDQNKVNHYKSLLKNVDE